MQQAMSGADFMHLTSLDDPDWIAVCLCTSCSLAGCSPCHEQCCSCREDLPCRVLGHAWRLSESLDPPIYIYFKHGENVLKFYYAEREQYDYNVVLEEWLTRLH